MTRYMVATCEGYPIGVGTSGSGSNVGLTASVLDTLDAHREIARFRSEDRLKGGYSVYRGVEGARRAAQEYADALNARCERT